MFTKPRGFVICHRLIVATVTDILGRDCLFVFRQIANFFTFVEFSENTFRHCVIVIQIVYINRMQWCGDNIVLG